MVLPAGSSDYGTAYDSGWDLHSADSYLPVFIPVSSPLHLCWNCGILRGTGAVDWSFLQPAALFRLVCDRTYCMQCDCHCLNRHALHAAASWCSKTAASFLMNKRITAKFISYIKIKLPFRKRTGTAVLFLIISKFIDHPLWQIMQSSLLSQVQLHSGILCTTFL